MRLFQDIREISKLVLILLLLIFFIAGAVFSYVWTMGFYAPSEYLLPRQGNITIENVHFHPDNATSFNVTVLNPSYSSDVKILQIKVETEDGKLHDAQPQLVPISVARGTLQTIESFWKWGNYTGQTVRVHVYISGGPGSSLQANTPFMNFTVTSVNLDPSVSVNHLNITVQNAGSSTSVNITRILVNGVEVSTTPALTPPYALTNASEAPPVSFMLMQNWTDLQGKTVAIAVETLQGYTAYKSVTAPPPVVLLIPSVVFNATISLQQFNVTVQNAESSPAKVDITKVTVHVPRENITAEIPFVPAPPQILQPGSEVLLTCNWDWSGYQGQNLTITVTVYTLQGFMVSKDVLIP